MLVGSSLININNHDLMSMGWTGSGSPSADRWDRIVISGVRWAWNMVLRFAPGWKAYENPGLVGYKRATVKPFLHEMASMLSSLGLI